MAWCRKAIILMNIGALKPPVWLTPNGICSTEGPGVISTWSGEVRLDVSGGQPVFSLGLPISRCLRDPQNASCLGRGAPVPNYYLKDIEKS